MMNTVRSDGHEASHCKLAEQLHKVCPAVQEVGISVFYYAGSTCNTK